MAVVNLLSINLKISESSILVAGCGGYGRMWCARLVQIHHQTRE